MRRFMVVRGDFLYLFSSPVSEKPSEAICLWFGATISIPPSAGKTFDHRPSSRSAESGFEFKISGGYNITTARLYVESSEARTAWKRGFEERIQSSCKRIEGAGLGGTSCLPTRPSGEWSRNKWTRHHYSKIITTKAKSLGPTRPNSQAADVAAQGARPPLPPSSVSSNPTPSVEAHNADSVPAVPLQISMNDTSLPKPPLPDPPQESGKLPVAQTMVNAKSKPGDAQVTVQHAMGFAAGMPLTISPGPAQISGDRVPPVHNNTIVGVNFNVIYLAAPLPHAITVGSIVMGFPSKAATSAGSDIIGPSISVNESTCANTSARATLGGTALASKVTGESVEKGSEESKESIGGQCRQCKPHENESQRLKMKWEIKAV